MQFKQLKLKNRQKTTKKGGKSSQRAEKYSPVQYNERTPDTPEV